MKRGPRVEGELGGGGRMGETEGNYNIPVPKGINKDIKLRSVQATQGMTTEWIFTTMVAGFLGFRMILLSYSQVLSVILWRVRFFFSEPSAAGGYSWLPAPLECNLANAGNTKQ